MKSLTGTEKQIKYANDLIEKNYQEIKSKFEARKERFAQKGRDINNPEDSNSQEMMFVIQTVENTTEASLIITAIKGFMYGFSAHDKSQFFNQKYSV